VYLFGSLYVKGEREMPAQQQHKSEVAKMRLQIQLENQAALLAVKGLSYGVSQHKFITMRMESIEGLHKQLVEKVGVEEADSILIEAMEVTEVQPPTGPQHVQAQG
jgi:hypothetical protein